MNRNLLIFGFFLVLLGVAFNFYLISLFGVLMLIPALMSPRRVPARPGTAPKPDLPKRVMPIVKPPQAESAPPAAGPQPVLEVVSVSSAYLGYSPSLFPNSIFVPMMASQYPAQPPPVEPKKSSERDELIEAGAMLALLKIFLG